jgi:hypothetical protein
MKNSTAFFRSAGGGGVESAIFNRGGTAAPLMPEVQQSRSKTPPSDGRSLPLWVGFLVLVAAGVCLCALADAIERDNCLSRWAGSSIGARFDWRHGCMVNAPGAGWIRERHFSVGSP